MEQPATSTTVTGPVGERLQAGTEYAPVLDRPAPLKCLYKCKKTVVYTRVNGALHIENCKNYKKVITHQHIA